MANRPRAVQKQVDETNALLESLTLKPGEAPRQNAPTPNELFAAPPVATPEPTEPKAEDTPPAQEPEAKPAEAAQPAAPVTDDFKQKYMVLKGKYDKEVPDLKILASEQAETIRQLELLIETMKDAPRDSSPPPPGKKRDPLIKPEELEEYGGEFFDVVGRRAQEAVADQVSRLQAKIDELSAKTSRSEKVEAVRSREAVLEALNEQVPGWDAINHDKQFLAWLADPDVFSNVSKRELLNQAFESNDAARVVKFFKAFQEDSAGSTPGARIPTVDPGTLIAPGSSRQGAPAEAPGGGRIISQNEISEFYAAVRQRKVSPEDRKRIEAEIMLAAAEGRVR